MEKPSSHRIVQKYNCIYTNETISLFSSVNVLRSAYSGTDSVAFDSSSCARLIVRLTS